jgi:hypothetical protein
MTKLQIQTIFQTRFKYLSLRSRFILISSSLDKFENFYKFFVEQKQTLNFKQLKNCGHKTELEINSLARTILRLSKNVIEEITQKHTTIFSEKAEILFFQEFDKLSVRTKNVLAAFGVNDLISFYDKIVKYNDVLTITKVRNCGDRTQNEIINFKNRISDLLNDSIVHEKNIELLSTDPEICSYKDEQRIQRNHFSVEEELAFDKMFEELSVRSKNILSNSQANELKSFVQNIINNRDLYDLRNLKNCGEKAKEEIELFKEKVLNFLERKHDSEISDYLFKDLWSYIFDGNIFRPTEMRIFSDKFGFIQGKDYETLDKIANEANLTKERVRQISFIVLEKIKNIISKLTAKNKNYLAKYFQKDFLNITDEITNEINEKEGTAFTTPFIIYALKSVEPSDYSFINTESKPQYYNGVFIKKTIHFDFAKCYEFLLQHIHSRRKQDIKFNLNSLLKSFNSKSLSPEKILIEEKNKILQALELLIANSAKNKNIVSTTSDTIILRKNTKKLIYESLVDILNERKTPMHFRDLYNECIKRGVSVSTDLAVHGIMQHYPKIFGLKGPGIYGLLEWGGYFGTIGDVTEKLLKERKIPIDRKELTEILSRELYISQDSINTVLFSYEPEKRFIKMRNNSVGLKEWADK